MHLVKKNYIQYLRFINPLLKGLKIKLPAYYWGLYPCKDNDVEFQKDFWNQEISKRPNQKISFNELKKQIIEKSKAIHEDVIENLEKEYGKKIDKIDDALIREKLSFMQSNFNLEKSRQNSIDNKFTQIIGQSSIVIAIVSIVIPIVNDKFHFNKEQWWFVGFIILIGVITVLYLLSSIWTSISNLKTRGYSRPMHNMILEHIDSSVRNFHIDQLGKYYDSTNTNIETNNIKADKVNLAYSRFIKGLIAFVLTSLFTTAYIMINPKTETKNVKISNQIEVSKIEKGLNSINSSLQIISNKNEKIQLEAELQNINNELQRLTKNIVHLADSVKNEEGNN